MNEVYEQNNPKFTFRTFTRANHTVEEEAEGQHEEVTQAFDAWVIEEHARAQRMVLNWRRHRDEKAFAAGLACASLGLHNHNFEPSRAARGALMVALDFAETCVYALEAEEKFAVFHAYVVKANEASYPSTEQGSGVVRQLWTWFNESLNEKGE